MTRKKGTASGPVRRGGGAGQRVKQFAAERGIRVPTSLVRIMAPDTPATPYAVGPAVADELAGGGAQPPSKSRRSTARRPAKKSLPRARATPPKNSPAPKTAAKPPGKSARRKSR
jgi:hypothetical protein